MREELRKVEKANKKAEEEYSELSQIRYSISVSPKTIDEATTEIKETKLEPTFRELLFKYIDESGMTDPEVYKKAHIDKRVFSKIRTDEKKYIPKKTAICLALALELNLDEFNKLLNANNDYIGENNYFDIAIVWCIKNNIYDIEQVNDILYACNLQLLTKD